MIDIVNMKSRKKSIRKIAINNLGIIMLILVMLSAILLIPRASALGIIPGRTTIDFAPSSESEIEFSVVNNEQKDMLVSLSVLGELAKYIELKEKNTSFFSTEERKTFIYKVKLPETLEPGLHTAEIVALDTPKTAEEGTHIGATVAVVSQLHVYVACPGKCINFDLDVLDAEQNSTAKFIVPVINRGKTRINEARAVIDIFSGENKIASVETDRLAVEPGARTELTGAWFVSIDKGSYKARVTIFYDNKVRMFEKDFTVGKALLDIERVWVSDFKLGGIAKLRILVENKWNQELKSVFANLIIYSKRNEVMSDLKSASEDIPASSKKELLVFWDTGGIEEGEYNGKLMIKHNEKSNDRELVLKVSANSLEVFGAGYAISPETTGTNIKTIVIIIIILLIITNLAWFVFFRRFLGKRKEKEKT